MEVTVMPRMLLVVGGVVALAAVVFVVFWLFGGRDKDE
jgi:hypothetical protein